MKYYHTEFDRQLLNSDLALCKLDGRSKASHRFPYRLESKDYNTINKFIEWGMNNLGLFSIYDVFYDSSYLNNKERLNAKWLIKSKTTDFGTAYVEFYIRKEDLPIVLLCWKEDGKQI